MPSVRRAATPDAAPVGGLQRQLSLEHEAIWLSALIAGRFDELSEAARRSLRRHRADRDDLTARIAAVGATPVGAQAGYGAPPASAEAARSRLSDLESRITAAALPLVSAGGTNERRDALRALRAAAEAQITWGGEPTAFPGLAGRTPQD